MGNLRSWFFLGSLALYLVFTSRARAQKTSASLGGTVTDESGAVVAGAGVPVASQETGATRTVHTDSTGSFNVLELNPGMYNIGVTKEGFKRVETRNIELHVNDVKSITVKLSVGALMETVEVEASETAIQPETETGAVGNVVNGQEVRELPLNGRNFVALTTLMPGAAVAESFDPKNKDLLSSIDISFSGSPTNSNQWLVDGPNNNDVGSQHTILVYPPIDTIEEFNILPTSH